MVIDFSPYAKSRRSGDGEAKQKLRKFEDDLQVAKKEQGQAKGNLEGTRRLFDKGFVTKIDLEKDEIANENSRLKVQTAETARDLFLKYEFPQDRRGIALQICRGGARTGARPQGRHLEAGPGRGQAEVSPGPIQHPDSRQRKELNEQLDKCTITATTPGLVVYGGGGDEDLSTAARNASAKAPPCANARPSSPSPT